MSLSRISKRVRSLYKLERFNEALETLEQFTRSGNELSSDLLVIKGCLIQLSDVPGFTLHHAAECFKMAKRLNKRNVDADIELGWLYSAALYDPVAARRCFKRAERLIRELKADISEGGASL